jgi:hypothetical protein
VEGSAGVVERHSGVLLMNLDDRQRAAGPLVHRPRHPLVAAAALFSASARAAGAVALERQGGERVRRLVLVARDAVRERRHPTRPRMRSVVLTRPGRLPSGRPQSPRFRVQAARS